MKQIRTMDAVGHVLCHDMPRIIRGGYKDACFQKGHIVTEEDVPVLLSMGREELCVWEMHRGMLHGNEATERLAVLCKNDHMELSEVKEGKVGLSAACDGLFLVDSARLRAINGLEGIVIATRRGGTAVRKGDQLAGARIIPLTIEERMLRAAEEAAGKMPLLTILPYIRRTAVVVATGSEVKKGLIQDAFTPVVKEKLASYGIKTVETLYADDGVESIAAVIAEAREIGADMVVCTGGMGADPDHNTPGAIRMSGARIVAYGLPVLPGAMLLLGYYGDNTVVMGVPDCVMYAGATAFDLVLPRVAAGMEVDRAVIAEMGEGGLCRGCKSCHWPDCPFGK